MQQEAFTTAAGIPVTAVTADEMRAVDRVAVEEVWLSLTRMMEHAGRSLAETVLDRGIQGKTDNPVVVLAGAGGNGGGGLVCARHLANRNIPTRVVLDRPSADVTGVPGEQLAILQRIDEIGISAAGTDPADLPAPSIVVDALLGYGLDGAPRGRAAGLIEWAKTVEGTTVALDVPSGVDATTGATPGAAVQPDVTLILALPKTGLHDTPGELLLADLSIPAVVYEELDIPYEQPFGPEFIVALSPN